MYIAMYVDRDGDYDVAGYFASRENAEKYIAAYLGADYFITEVSCLDKEKDLTNVKVSYKHNVAFMSKYIEDWSGGFCDNPFPYGSDYELCDGNCTENEVEMADTSFYGEIIICSVILSEPDWDIAIKTAKEMASQFLDFCGNNPTETFAKEFNYKLREISAEI